MAYFRYPFVSSFRPNPRTFAMKILTDQVIPARKGGAWVVKKGQHIRVIEVQGGQIGDFVTFNANNLRERFSQARTKANQGKLFISTGDHLYTRDNHILLTIAEDTYGHHDLQYGMCSKWTYESPEHHGRTTRFTLGGPLGPPDFGCYEILTQTLKAWNIPPEDIPDPLNLFQTMDIDWKTGKMGIVDGRSKPGDYIDFVAKMDTLCALSACPSTGKPLRVLHYEE